MAKRRGQIDCRSGVEWVGRGVGKKLSVIGDV
jgi:hypothetical protein